MEVVPPQYSILEGEYPIDFCSTQGREFPVNFEGASVLRRRKIGDSKKKIKQKKMSEIGEKKRKRKGRSERKDPRGSASSAAKLVVSIDPGGDHF